MLDIDISKVRLNNGMTIEEMLKSEADRFLKILQEEISEWYTLYRPQVYNRTFNTLKSIYAEDIVDVSSSGTNLEVRIKYTGLAFHNSIFGGEDANTLLLMNCGYAVKSGWHKNIPNFGFRAGGNFLEKAVERFQKDNIFGITIKTNY